MRLDIKKIHSTVSERVKSVEFHPTEPWVLLSLFNGQVQLWNYNTKQLVKTFEITELPVRIARFVPRKCWIITGSDDMCIRIFNYDTMERVKIIENAHQDYIRFIAVHPTQPCFLSCSDDMTIKMWNWDSGFANTQVFEGHSHYVMQVVFNPKDSNTFASASLDKTIKVWGLGAPSPNYTLEGHKKGVNCVAYYAGGEKPYLVSGADEGTIKVWDYQTKSCIATLEGHTHNLSAVLFHPTLPLIISTAEDNTVKLWTSTTFRLETTINHNLGRGWALAVVGNSTALAIGYDTGYVMVKLGREEPLASMDNSGKIVVTKNNEILQANIRSIADEEMKDGEPLPLSLKSQCNCEVYPQELYHNPNGRFVSVTGDGEYVIYTALAWRSKSFGQGKEVVWSSGGDYAVRESYNRLKIYTKNFKERSTLDVDFSISNSFGGAYLGLRSSSFLSFYDWETMKHVRRIDVEPKNVYWSESGDNLAITTETSFYVLRCKRNMINDMIANNATIPDEGIEDAFDVVVEKSEIVTSAAWVGDCFLYTTVANRLCYIVGNESFVVAHLDRPMFMLGYVASLSRIVLIDKNQAIITYMLNIAVLEYQTLVLRQEYAAAEQLVPSIPQDQRNKIARFLDSQGFKQQALQLSTDNDHRFDLAIQLGMLSLAKDILIESPDRERWYTLAEVALSRMDLALAEEAMTKGEDYSGLLLLYTSLGRVDKLEQLVGSAVGGMKNNVAFLSAYLAGNTDKCMELLFKANKYPESALFARTYCPAMIDSAVTKWKSSLSNVKLGEALATPSEYPNLFPGVTEQ